MTLSAYLSSLAVSDAQLAHASSRFDAAVNALGALLAEPIACVYREQLAGDIADAWVVDASAAVNLLSRRGRLRTTATAASPEQREARDLMHTLAANLSEQDDAHLRYESASCGRELAQRALSRWFAILGQHDASSAEGVALNANLLPDAGELNDISSRVEAVSYGVQPLVVSRALRLYWDCLFVEFASDRQPIELGPSLWIVPEARVEPRTYRLFDNKGHAAAFVRRESASPRAPAAHSAASIMRRAWAHIGQRPDLSSSEQIVVALQSSFGIPTAGKARDKDFTWSTVRGTEMAFLGRPNRAFAQSVEVGLDAIMSVQGFPDDEAVERLKSSGEEVRIKLRQYARSKRLPIGAVCSAYAGGVTYAVIAQGAREAGFPTGEPESFAARFDDLWRRFSSALNLRGRPARELASTTARGAGRLI